MRILLFFVFFLSLTTSNAQDCERVLISGKVVDSLRPQNFYNLMIVNRTKGKGVFGMPSGRYSLYVDEGDSITFSIKGYEKVDFVVKVDSTCRLNNIFYLTMIPLEFDEVVIHPLKTLSQIQEEREALAMRETRMVTGIEVLRSPITALYERFSKREQSKQLAAKLIYEDKQKGVLQDLLRLYVVYDIFDLNESEFDAFITFLNINEDFLKTASELELVIFIKDKFEHFELLNQN
ncbi:hypothetical protein N8328_05100 [Crocinitomicaceae bacterium]|nr:hypothetical protein [Crocinitomicaceae bacterium]